MKKTYHFQRTQRLFALTVLFGTYAFTGYCENDWTWVGGFNEPNKLFNGIVPPSVEKPAVAKDQLGNVYLFGGIAWGHYMDPLTGARDDFGSLNDIYRYSESTGFQKLDGGSPDLNPTTNYGTIKVSAPTNRIGGRQGATLWTDNAGNPWTFGGYGSNTGGASQMTYTSALWKFDGTHWVWMKGPSTHAAAGEYGAKGIAASANNPGARFNPVYWKDSSGNFCMFGGYGYDSIGWEGFLNDIWKYDVATENWTWVSGSEFIDAESVMDNVIPANSSPAARTLAASWVDATGNLWIYGGQGFDQTTSLFGNYSDMWKFDGTVWTRIKNSTVFNLLPNYGTKGVASPSAHPGGRYNATTWVDAQGMLWLYGGQNTNDMNEDVLHSDLWRFDGVNWAWMSGSQALSVPANYGTLDVTAATNTPGGRSGGASWRSSDGFLMMFGGKYFYEYDIDRHNDLWKLDPRSSGVDDWKIY